MCLIPEKIKYDDQIFASLNSSRNSIISDEWGQGAHDRQVLFLRPLMKTENRSFISVNWHKLWQRIPLKWTLWIPIFLLRKQMKTGDWRYQLFYPYVLRFWFFCWRFFFIDKDQWKTKKVFLSRVLYHLFTLKTLLFHQSFAR